MLNAIKLAKVNLTMETGVIVNWFKNEGDFVKQDEPIFEVETDKATVVVESFYTGYLKKIINITSKVKNQIFLLEITDQMRCLCLSSTTVLF